MSRYAEVEQLVANLDNGLWGKDWDKALAEAIIRDAPTIEVSEDCISREDLLKHAYKREGVLSVSVDSIKLAPSVAPKRAEGEWIYCEDDEEQDGYRCSDGCA